MSAIVDKQTGKVVALLVTGKAGQRYVATVDAAAPSRLLLAAQKQRPGGKAPAVGGAFALQTRYDAVTLDNRPQVESIFRVAGWEDALQPLRR